MSEEHEEGPPPQESPQEGLPEGEDQREGLPAPPPSRPPQEEEEEEGQREGLPAPPPSRPPQELEDEEQQEQEQDSEDERSGNEEEEEEIPEEEEGEQEEGEMEDPWDHFCMLLKREGVQLSSITSEQDVKIVFDELWNDASKEDIKIVTEKWLSKFCETMKPLGPTDKGNIRYFDREAYDNITENINFAEDDDDAGGSNSDINTTSTRGVCFLATTKERQVEPKIAGGWQNYAFPSFAVRSSALHPTVPAPSSSSSPLSSAPSLPHWHVSILRALAAMEAGDWKNVREHVNAALEANPHNVAGLILRDIVQDISPETFGPAVPCRERVVRILNAGGERKAHWDKYFARLRGAASREYPRALTLCGEYAYLYVGDFYTAARLFAESAAAGGGGCCHAMYRLSVMYHEGLGVKQSARAAYWYAKEALHRGMGQNILGYFISSNVVSVKDYALANTFFRAAAAGGRGLCVSMHNLGFSYRQGDATAIDNHRAFLLFERAAAAGYERAYFQVGLMCQRGIGTEVNYVRAIDSYVASHMLDIKTNISVCFRDKETRAVFRRRAEAGDTTAQILCYVHNIGKCDSGGGGDDSKSVGEDGTLELLKRAARTGKGTDAMCLLAAHYGEAGNKEETSKWLKRARAKGSLVAELLSGMYYWAGTGLRKSTILSMVSFRTASRFIGITEYFAFAYMGIHLQLGSYCDNNSNDYDALFALGKTLELVARYNKTYNYDTVIQVYTQAAEHEKEAAKEALTHFQSYSNPHMRSHV